MLILDYKQILDKEKDKPIYVCGHGPSLKKYIKFVENKQKDNSLRLSVNDWWNFFDVEPQYCCWASSETRIEQHMNKKNTFFFYADSADMTNRKNIIDSNLQVFGYDQRHYKNHNCKTILNEFYNAKDKENFSLYGNNKEMWLDGRAKEFAGFDPHYRCCRNIINNRPTVQEFLQKISNLDKHYSTSDTVSFHAIAFSIILGCNPIYILGLDLNYGLGYANGNLCPYQDDEWNKFKRNTINDLTILSDSAKSRGIRIINLTNNPWYGNIFEIGEI